MMHVRMKVHTTRTPLDGLLIVNIDYFKDERGFFMESWNRASFADAGITDDFVQDSHSASGYGVVRGMHYQDISSPMAKLVRCTAGKILDVAIDLRMSSPTFGRAFSIELTAENKTLIYVPVGFAHGFATMSDCCEVQYKQSGFYNPAAEGGIIWNDPEIAIPWPYPNPVLSQKDGRLPTLADYRKKPAFPD
jgi:dTDP-4-dehydrorhamnose 3,5-epimerase